MLTSLAATDRPSRYALILAGIPAAMEEQGEAQLQQFLALAQPSAPVVRYRKFTGEFASASAVAAAFAASFLKSEVVPGNFLGGGDIAIDASRNTILVLGFGHFLTAMELYVDTQQ